MIPKMMTGNMFPIASDTLPTVTTRLTVTENTYKLSTKALGESSDFNKEWDILGQPIGLLAC